MQLAAQQRSACLVRATPQRRVVVCRAQQQQVGTRGRVGCERAGVPRLAAASGRQWAYRRLPGGIGNL